MRREPTRTESGGAIAQLAGLTQLDLSGTAITVAHLEAAGNVSGHRGLRFRSGNASRPVIDRTIREPNGNA